MKRQSSKQSGFTLVEIAIVLVIIGLLLGGVLKGQELITGSKAKATVADQKAMLAAMISYTDRFKTLAGDDAGAAARFPLAACGNAGVACINGNGNGQLTGAWNLVAPAAPTAAANENTIAWQHLRAAGFIAQGDGTIFSNPRNNAGGIIGMQNGIVYIGQPATGTSIAFGAVPSNVAQALDSSYDDGFANLGQWRNAANGTAAAPNTVAGALYVAGGTNNIATSLQ